MSHLYISGVSNSVSSAIVRLCRFYFISQSIRVNLRTYAITTIRLRLLRNIIYAEIAVNIVTIVTQYTEIYTTHFAV